MLSEESKRRQRKVDELARWIQESWCLSGPDGEIVPEAVSHYSAIVSEQVGAPVVLMPVYDPRWRWPRVVGVLVPQLPGWGLT